MADKNHVSTAWGLNAWLALAARHFETAAVLGGRQRRVATAAAAAVPSPRPPGSAHPAPPTQLTLQACSASSQSHDLTTSVRCIAKHREDTRDSEIAALLAPYLGAGGSRGRALQQSLLQCATHRRQA